MNQLIRKTIEELQRNHMAGYCVADKQELLLLLSDLIPKGQTVGCGDSVTLEEMGVYDFLRSKNYVFHDKYLPGLTSKEKRRLYIQNFDADTFVTGTNAITTDGKLFNIDGNGSRVAPMIYGPRQVIVVAGVNKITEDVDSAIRRARQIAAPQDAVRLQKDTPCTRLNRCVDCRHPQRICNDFVLIAGQFIKDRIKVILVEKELGY
ncbi:lactate utilization protein [Clostridium minihomine]|uniref:lactate utilization protein n=1 Tax=Clostridium minihomine TaxID=2045012 RepID=UPI000C76E98F|nr:lactate utilization protein [Clostridium minihomine]